MVVLAFRKPSIRLHDFVEVRAILASSDFCRSYAPSAAVQLCRAHHKRFLTVPKAFMLHYLCFQIENPSTDSLSV